MKLRNLIRMAHERISTRTVDALASRVAQRYLDSSMMITVPAVQVQEVEEEEDEEQGSGTVQKILGEVKKISVK